MKISFKVVGILLVTAGLAIIIERFLLSLLNARVRKSFESVPSTLAATGSRMSEAEAVRQEELLRTSQYDVNVRGLLLGYYGRAEASEADYKKFQQHALWIVEHRPNHPVASLCRFEQTAAYERLAGLPLNFL